MRTLTEKSVWASTRKLRRALPLRDWRTKLVPLDYVRTRELPAVVDLVQPMRLPPACRVLDIASPQMLSLHLGLSHPEWRITYLNPYAPELDQMRRWSAALNLAGVDLFSGDARQVDTFGPESFDLILCSSVLEHIGDEEGQLGDTVVMRNIDRWLSAVGQVVLSVPYARDGFDEFTASPVYGGVAFPAGRQNFFQRFYDADGLASRLLESSGLKVDQLSYLGERRYHEDDPHRRLAVTLAKSRWRYLLGGLYPWLADYFLEAATDPAVLRKPYIAIARLCKP